MDVQNFFGELKRRNVYKVAIAYAVIDVAAHSGWVQILFSHPSKRRGGLMKVFVTIIVARFSNRADSGLGI